MCSVAPVKHTHPHTLSHWGLPCVILSLSYFAPSPPLLTRYLSNHPHAPSPPSPFITSHPRLFFSLSLSLSLYPLHSHPLSLFHSDMHTALTYSHPHPLSFHSSCSKASAWSPSLPRRHLIWSHRFLTFHTSHFALWPSSASSHSSKLHVLICLYLSIFGSDAKVWVTSPSCSQWLIWNQKLLMSPLCVCVYVCYGLNPPGALRGVVTHGWDGLSFVVAEEGLFVEFTDGKDCLLK